jgi:hypothetical protein
VISNLALIIQRLNLLQNVKDIILISKKANHRNIKGIKVKLLVSINDTSKNALTEVLNI